MRIIHYIPDIDRKSGGTSTYIQQLGNELGKIANVHILTYKTEQPLPIDNCTIHYISPYKPFSATWAKEINSLMDSLQPDIVNINGCWLPVCSAIQRIAQKRGIKVVLTPHGMLEPWIIHRHYWTRKLPALLLFQKAAIATADYIHATADSESENLAKLGYNTKIKVIKLGIATDGIDLKTSWAKSNKILFISRVHEKKGINHLIEAAAALRTELQGHKIIIAGEGDAGYVATLKNMVAEKGLGDIVEFVGGVYGDAKWELIRSADFMALPTHSENFGLAIAECLASGTPVITTVGTPWEDLNTTSSGAWIEIGTEPLIAALRQFLALSAADLEAMGRRGRQLIETKYSARAMAAEMMEMYAQLTSNSSQLAVV